MDLRKEMRKMISTEKVTPTHPKQQPGHGLFADTERSLEFDKIKAIWASMALTDQAKERIFSAVPCLCENELLVRLRETTQARKIIESWGNPPLVSMSGIRERFAMAAKGECLTPAQLEEIELALTAVMRLKDYLTRCRQQQIPLAYYDENLDCLEELRDSIRQQIRNGKVEDGASRLLKSLREDIDRLQNRMREKADSVIRANKDCMSDSFCTFRNGRLCVPVKKEYKFRVSGSVIDKSATGGTLFMEPTAVAKIYEELELLRIEAENEERRILYVLTGLAADQAPVMEQNISMIEKLDFIFSKGKFSLEYDGTEPQINTDRKLVIEEGRHPLMDKKVCVPLSLELGGQVQGMVITGPNTGGKTVAIKTVALNALMAQCSLHVACRGAKICMNSQYLCDIGDGQSLSENLSTFSAHIANVLEILRHVDRESLVIMDELGSGTDPTEGMGLAIAILEELRESGAMFLVTTHYPEVKTYAQDQKNVINARMTFDKESLKPLYRLVPGEAGESCALYIARKLGMPGYMLQTAVKAAYKDQIPDGMDFGEGGTLAREKGPGIQKRKQGAIKQEDADKYQPGDSVMVYPDKKIGIVCGKADPKGVLQVQLPGKKIWINHKRVKLVVAAEKLYPEDYDFSIIFDTVENRKLRHAMERKHVENGAVVLEE